MASMSTTPWRMQRETADALAVSERTLHRWRSAGLLRAGHHYRRKFPSANSPLLYHLERCEETMSQACALGPAIESAPEGSRERPIESHRPAPTRSNRSADSFPLRAITTRHRPPQGQPREDAQPLPHGVIHPVAGAVAEHLSGIQGHRPRVRLRRGRLLG